MLKKINTGSHLYKLMDKYSIKEKYNELYKRNLILIKDFANIQNINLLDDFCKKYKTNKEELPKIDFLINTIDYNRTEDIQIVNIKLLVLLTNNHFMLDFFLKEDSEFYNKPLGVNTNRNNKNNSNMTAKDFINLSCHFYNAFYSEINNSDSVLKRYLKSALDIFKENNNQIQFFVEILINYLNRSIIEDENILQSLDIMLERKIKDSNFNSFIEEKASNFIGNKKTFEKMCEIVDFNIFNDKCLLEMLKNEDYFEKALNKFGYQKLDKIYSSIYNAKQLNKYRTGLESNDNLQEIIINTSSINISNKINILEVLEKKGKLKNIINKDNQFLNRIFLESKSNRILTEDNYNFLDYLKEKYDYNYLLSNFNNDSDINTIQIITDDIRINENSSEKDFLLYILNQKSLIPGQVFIKIFNKCCYFKDIEIIETFFKNNILNDNNQLYEILLTNFNNDKRRKNLNDNDGIDFFHYLLSDDFKNKNNITIDDKKTINFLKNRKSSINKNVVDIFIEKLILNNCFLENKNEIKIIKKRI